MCQLLGISFSELRPFHKLFAEFRKRGKSNPHAWGIAYWLGNGHGPAVIREARASDESPLAAMLAETPIPVKTAVAHVRLGTTNGKWSLKSTTNAHPFLFNVGETDWAGAHNGYIRGVGPTAHRPAGTTDSEAFFCAVADELAASAAAYVDEKLAAVSRAAEKYQLKGKLNFLLSDGETLFFSANHPAATGGLYYIELHRGGKHALIVATQPLFSDEGWLVVEPGWVYAARDGAFGKKRRLYDYTEPSLFPGFGKSAVRTLPRRHLSYIDYWQEQIRKAATN